MPIDLKGLPDELIAQISKKSGGTYQSKRQLREINRTIRFYKRRLEMLMKEKKGLQ